MTTGQDGRTSERVEALVRSLSNDEIRWDGTAIGLLPKLRAMPARNFSKAAQRSCLSS